MSKGLKKPQYKPIELNSNIVYGITSVDNISQAELDSIQWLCEAYEHQNKQIADLEGHIKGLTKVRNYEKCKHIRKRKRLQQQIAELEKRWNNLKQLIEKDIDHNEKQWEESYISVFHNYIASELWVLDRMEELEKEQEDEGKRQDKLS